MSNMQVEGFQSGSMLRAKIVVKVAPLSRLVPFYDRYPQALHSLLPSQTFRLADCAML